MSLDQAAAFLQETLTNVTFGIAFGKVVEGGDPTAIQTFITSSGYDCTPTEVWQVSESMKAHDLAYWIGTYGKTYYKQGANWVQGKTLSVQDANTVTYGGEALT